MLSILVIICVVTGAVTLIAVLHHFFVTRVMGLCPYCSSRANHDISIGKGEYRCGTCMKHRNNGRFK